MNPEELIAPAMLPPLAAYVLSRDADAVRLLESKGRSLLANGQAAAGNQLLVGAEFLRRAARAQAAVMGVAPVSGDGSSEVPRGGDGGGSERPPGTGLTTGEVVERFRSAGLQISGRQVRNLCESGRLSATWMGRTRLVDEVSLADEIQRRQEDRER